MSADICCASDPLVERIAQFDVCTISDALDRCSIPGQFSNGIDPMWPGGSVAGRVVAMKLVAAAISDRGNRHLGAAAVDAAKPRNVVVVEHPGIPASRWGGRLAAAVVARGVSG